MLLFLLKIMEKPHSTDLISDRTGLWVCWASQFPRENMRRCQKSDLENLWEFSYGWKIHLQHCSHGVSWELDGIGVFPLTHGHFPRATRPETQQKWPWFAVNGPIHFTNWCCMCHIFIPVGYKLYYTIALHFSLVIKICCLPLFCLLVSTQYFLVELAFCSVADGISCLFVKWYSIPVYVYKCKLLLDVFVWKEATP